MSVEIRVLLVDDEALVLSSLRRLLTRAGFAVLTVLSAAEALERLAAERVDVVVSDYRMPGMNGIELLRRVAESLPEIPRVMLTAQADRAQLVTALQDGTLHRAWRKPWDNARIVEDLRALVLNAAGGGAA